MKVKNASFVQMHIEKVILAVGILFFLIAIGVIVFGVILKPYQVELANRTYDQPADIIPAQVENAERLKIELGQTPEIPEDYEQPDLSTDYQQMLEHPVSVAQRLPRIAPEGLTPQAWNPETPPPPSYFLPTPPMVTSIEYKHGFEVLDDTDSRILQQYAQLWGGEAQVPADFSYVFVEGEFDMAAWVEALQQDGVDNIVPPGIWRNKLGLANVYLVREERDPVTGEWTNATVVPVLPDYRGAVPDKPIDQGGASATEWIEYFLSWQVDIATVQPPPLTDGDELLPPLDDPMLMFDAEALEAMDAAQRAEERRRRAEEREAERAARAAEREANRNRDNGPAGPGIGSGRGGRGGGGRGGASNGRGDSSSGRDSGRDSGRPNPNPEEFSAPPGRGVDNPREPGRGGVDRGGSPARGVVPGRGDTPGRGGLDRPDGSEPNSAMMRVWAIDVTVEPGKTYRYKLIAGVINPLYGVERLDEAQRTENLHRAALAPSQEDIDEADWTDPIEIEASTRFFVVSASERGARVNVWRVHNGERIKETFDVDAGDAIGGVVSGVDMRVGATVVDIDRRKDINGSTVWIMIYIDEHGELFERTLQADQTASSQFERVLREEAETRARAEELAAPASGPDGFGGPGTRGPGGFEPGLIGP